MNANSSPGRRLTHSVDWRAGTGRAARGLKLCHRPIKRLPLTSSLPQLGCQGAWVPVYRIQNRKSELRRAADSGALSSVCTLSYTTLIAEIRGWVGGWLAEFQLDSCIFWRIQYIEYWYCVRQAFTRCTTVREIDQEYLQCRTTAAHDSNQRAKSTNIQLFLLSRKDGGRIKI